MPRRKTKAAARSHKTGTTPRSVPRCVSLLREWLPGLILVVATAWVYGNTFGVPFLFDDSKAIAQNPTIDHLWPLWPALSPPNDGSPVDSRPILNLSFAANHALNGLEVGGYHALSLAIHVLAALVLLGVIRQTLRMPGMPERLTRNATVLATSIALIWSIHPLQTESVTYISQRAESLVSLFYLLTLYCMIRGARSTRPGPWYSAAVVACCLGMGSKEVMASAPLIALLYDRTFIAGSFAEAIKRRWALYAGLAATWLVLAGLVIDSSGRNATVGFGLLINPWNYALTQCGVIARYLRLSLWPSGLCLDHGDAVVQNAWSVLPQAVVVVALVLFTIWALWKRPKVGFLGAFFLAVLAPTSSVVPVITQTVAEHRMYLPLAAVVTAVVIGGYLVGQRLVLGKRSTGSSAASKAIGLVLIGAVVIALGMATYLRNEDYRDEVSIWQDTVQKCPDNARAHNNLAVALKDRGETDGVITHYRQALRLKPDYALAHHNLGIALAHRGEVDEAIVHYRRALELDSDNADIFSSLGAALTRRGKIDEAIALCRRALELDPNNADAYYNLGICLAGRGEIDGAIAQFRRAVELQPDKIESRVNLGMVLARRGEIDAAMNELRKALEINSDSADAHDKLGMLLASRGKLDEAIGHFRKAIAIDPQHGTAIRNLRLALAQAGTAPKTLAELRAALQTSPNDPLLLNNTAWILATSPDASMRNGAEAVELARRAVALSHGKEPVILATLAAAYAELGRFDDAAQTARQAADLAARRKQSELAASLRAKMRLYEQGKTPFPKAADKVK